jgi:hypothetical protein
LILIVKHPVELNGAMKMLRTFVNSTFVWNRNAGIYDSAYTYRIIKAYTLAGLAQWKIELMAKKHIMRKVVSHNAQDAGVQRPAVQFHGGWQSGGLHNYSYLTQVDEDCMHHGACTLSCVVLCLSQ